MPKQAMQKQTGENFWCDSKIAIQWTENMMNLLKKAAITLAATSMIAAPVAASAADATPSVSTVDGQSELAGGSGWIVAVLALAAIIGGIVIASDNDDDNPTSP